MEPLACSNNEKLQAEWDATMKGQTKASKGLSGMIQLLCDHTVSDAEQEKVCKKIASICTVGPQRNSLVQDALLAEGAVESLVHLAGGTTNDRLKTLAVIALNCTCEQHSAAKYEACQAGALDLLVDCLRNGSRRCQEAASTVLIHITDGIMHLEESDLGTPEGLALIIGLIKYDVSTTDVCRNTICENCTWILGNIACHPVFHGPIRRYGGVSALLSLLQIATAKRNLEMCYRALWSLSSLAGDRPCQDEVRKCNGIPLITMQLDAVAWTASAVTTVERKIVQIAAHIISNMAVDQLNQQELLEAGAIPLLMRLLDGKVDGKVRLMASWALSNLAANPRTHYVMHKYDAIPKFANLLARSQFDHWVRLRMTVALGNLACDSTENKDIIRESGAISLLVSMLSSPDKDLLERCVIALENLSTDNHENQREVARAGALCKFPCAHHEHLLSAPRVARAWPLYVSP